MADMTRIVDEIRGFLLSYDQVLTPEITTLASDYATACANANKRLAKCQRRLQTGHRVEALHDSRQAPDLLELIQTADFPERLAWLEVVNQYNLTSPPEFDAIAIEFLQSAYIEDDPLKDLLKGHRRLALMRAPLRQRIEVLRQLAVKDEHNPIWSIDIQGFETARLDQIKEEANTAKRRDDLEALSILLAELSAPGWLIPLPRGLVSGISRKIEDLREAGALEELRELIVKLNAEFERLDFDTALKHQIRWQEIEKRYPRIVDLTLSSQVEPVFLWVDECKAVGITEDEYFQALTDLEYGLDANLPRVELSRLLEDSLRYNRGIPEDLEARYKARIDQFVSASKWKTKITIACVALGLTLVCGLLLLLNR